MYDLNSMKYFVKVVICRSFTEAAKVLGVPKSTVSDKVAELEASLGVTLLTRTTRKLTLTDVGAEFFRKAESALVQLETAGEEAAQAQRTPTGTLRITAPSEIFLINAISGAVTEYKKRFPGVKIDLDFDDRKVDIIGEGHDIAVRAGNLKDSSLMAKRIGSSSQILVASKSYLQKGSLPTHPRDLRHHTCLLHGKSFNGSWTFRSKEGKAATIQFQSATLSNSFPSLRALALAGQGVALLPHPICFRDVAERKLVRVLPDWATAESSLHLVYPPQRFASPKVKEMLPLLEKSLRDFLHARKN